MARLRLRLQIPGPSLNGLRDIRRRLCLGNNTHQVGDQEVQVPVVGAANGALSEYRRGVLLPGLVFHIRRGFQVGPLGQGAWLRGLETRQVLPNSRGRHHSPCPLITRGRDGDVCPEGR